MANTQKHIIDQNAFSMIVLDKDQQSKTLARRKGFINRPDCCIEYLARRD